MRSSIVKVLGGGRVTIPFGIRDIESIKKGDYLEISFKKIKRSKDNNRKNKESRK